MMARMIQNRLLRMHPRDIPSNFAISFIIIARMNIPTKSGSRVRQTIDGRLPVDGGIKFT